MTHAPWRVLGGHWPLTWAAAAPDKEAEAGLKVEGLQSLPSPSTHGASAVPGSGEEGGEGSAGHLPAEKRGAAGAWASSLSGGQGPGAGLSPCPGGGAAVRELRGPDAKPWGRRADLRVRWELHSLLKYLLSFL